MPKAAELPKTVVCKYCEQTVHEGDETYRLACGQLKAIQALHTHYATCKKAQGQVRLKVRSAVKKTSHSKPMTNCPCCGDAELMRSDHLARHMISKHLFQSVESMYPKYREDAIRLKAPIVKAEHGGRPIIRFCLHCKKSITEHGHCRLGTASLLATLDSVVRTEDHKECIAAFEKYRDVFECRSDVYKQLPFKIYYPSDVEEPVGGTGCAECVAKDERITSLTGNRDFWKTQYDEAVKAKTVGDTEPPKTVVDPLIEPLIAAVRVLLGDDDEENPWPLEEVLEEVKVFQASIKRKTEKVCAGLQNQIAALKKQLDEKESVAEVFETLRFKMAGKTDDDDY